MTDNISLQITVSKKETFQPTPLRGRLALVVNLALLMGLSARLRAMRMKKDGTPTIVLK